MREIRQRVVTTGQMITAVIEAALRDLLERERRIEGADFTLRWTVVPGRAQSGVDLADRDALCESMNDLS